MESSIPNSTSSAVSVATNYEMDSSNEDIDQQVLREAGEQTISAEWSATVSALSSSNATSSNSFINIETLKECCANPSDTLKDKEDFMVFESSSTVVNSSKFNANDTKYYPEHKTTAFQKKHKPFSQNVSCYFENVLDDDSQMEITQNSICLNRFQKRKRLIPPNDDDFIEINNSNSNGSNSVDVSMMKSPKFCFSRKKKDQFEIPDYNLSATDSDSIANDTNTPNRRNTSNVSLVNESSDNMKNVSKTETFTHKFNLKTIDVADSVFENIINNSSIVSDITSNNKKTSLNEIALSNNTSVLSKKDLSNLNHTYDIIPNNTNSTLVKASIVDDDDTPKVKQNTVFKKPSNLSILVNDSSNNIMDLSKTEVFTQKFSRKSIGIPDSAFDNIINDSTMTSDVALNHKKSFLNETSVSNINTSTNYVSITDNANMPSLKQLNSFNNVNDCSNKIDVSKTEVLTPKFSRKAIDVADSVFDNIINNSSLISNITLNNRNVSPTKILVSNVDDPVHNKMDMSGLNHTYDIPTNIDISFASDANIPQVKQNTDLKKPANSSLVINNSSNNKIDVTKTEVLTHKFNRKTIDVTHSVFDNIINDSSMTSEIALNNQKVSLIETSVSNANNTSVFSTMDVSNLNHTYDIPNNNNTTLLDAIVEDDKSISETPVLIQNNRSKSFNLLPLKFNFSNKFGRHSLSLQENCPSIGIVKKHNISLNTDFIKNTGEESTSFHKSANNSNRNLKLHPHICVIQENNSSPEIQPLDDSLPTNRLNQEPNHSISSSSTNEGLTLLNSTSGLLGSCSSSRTHSRLLTSKQSKSSTSNNDSLNLTMESLDSNESKNDQSKHSISSTSSNEGLTLINSTTGFSRSRSSSRSRSTSKLSNNDSLTLLNTTTESLKSNKSQITQSKHSKSPTSFNESLKSTNSTTEFSKRRSSSINKSTSSKHSTSAVSNSDNLSLQNTSIGSLKNNESPKMQSKRSISPSSYSESLKSTHFIKEYSGKRKSTRSKSTSSKHSTSVISNNESSTSSNDSTEISVGSRSSRNKSLSTSSKHSTNVISNGDNLLLLDSSMGSLKNNESQKMQSKRSKSPTSYNESLKSTNSTAALSGKRRSSRNKSISSKHSTSVILNSENLPLLNATTVGSLKNNESQKTYSKRSISLNSSKESIKSTNSATGISGKHSSSRNKSSLLTSKHSTSVVSNNDSITSLNATTEISVGSRLSRNQTQHSTSVISNNNTLSLSNASNMESLKSNKSLKTQSTSPTLNIEHLNMFNTTTESLKQNALSINRSTSKHSSSVISQKASINALMLDDVINNVSRMSTSSSKQKNNCSGNVEPVTHDDIEQIKPNTYNGPLIETRVLRSSLRINKNKSLLTKSLMTESNVNDLSIGSTRTSKDMVNFDNNGDDSLLWTTLPDDSTNISSTQNINMDTFQTPKRNKLTIAENIVNTIKIMSTNNKKSTHPGAFELDDHNDRPTRSFVTRSYNRSPSILTLVFGGQKTSESTSSLSQSPPEIIFDQSQVEENVKQKFKSLYKKEPWITKRLYKFLIIKLQPNYNIYSAKYAEKFVKYLAQLFKQIYNDQVDLQLCTDMLRYHMARYNIIKDTFDYIGFLTDYIPMVYYKKLVPGWNLETSAIKFDPQKYYIPLMDDEEFLNYIMEHLNKA